MVTGEDGEPFCDNKGIKGKMIRYFQTLWRKPDNLLPMNNQLLDNVVKDKLNREQRDDLKAEVTKEEVEVDLFSMGEKKAFGLDGFNVVFFKCAWLIVGELVVKAILSFLSLGRLLKALNHNYFSFSEIPTLNCLNDYRSISYCNVI